jgi:flagellin FlaB
MRCTEVTDMKNKKMDNAFTGLEAAIVLIAFVVVAAVFSYVVLGAGFFTTQKAQEVVHSSMEQASSSIEIIGSVYGMGAGSASINLSYIKFNLGLTAGGTPVDVSKMVVSYQDERTRWSNLTYWGVNATPSAVWNKQVWAINATYNPVGGVYDTVLEQGEQMVLIVGVPNTAVNNTQIRINLQPAVGAVFQITRTLPASLDAVNILY